MALIRPNALNEDTTPEQDDVLIIDGASVRKSTIVDVVNAARPFASQGEAEAGTATDVGMNPLATKQAIEALGLVPGDIGSTVQSSDPVLDSLAGLNLSTGDILYATGSSTLVRLPAGDEEDVLAIQSGVPAWRSSGVMDAQSVQGVEPGTTGLAVLGAETPEDGANEIGQFSTRTAATNSALASAPDYIRTAGYSAVDDGGNALYANNSTTTGDLVITLDDGSTDVGYDLVEVAPRGRVKQSIHLAQNLKAVSGRPSDDIRITCDRIPLYDTNGNGLWFDSADVTIDKTVSGENGLDAPLPVEGAVFDGTNDWLERASDLNGIADGKTGTVSFWFNRNGNFGSVQTLLRSSNNGRFQITFTTDDEVQIICQTSGDTIILNLQSTTTITGGGWNHCVASWDLAAGVSHLYLNADEDANEATNTDATIDYTDGGVAIGARAASVNHLDATLAQFWFNTEYVDLSDFENRNKFVRGHRNTRSSEVTWGIADMGSDGSLATGTQPLIFLDGTVDDWHVNKGTGGGFTENGELTEPGNAPNMNATWLRTYLIAKPDGTVAGLLSASPDSPTLPTGYRYAGRVGAVLNAAEGFREFIQRGKIHQTPQWQTITDAPETGQQERLDLFLRAPPEAVAVGLQAVLNNGTGGRSNVSLTLSAGTDAGVRDFNSRTVSFGQDTGETYRHQIPSLLLESEQTVYYFLGVADTAAEEINVNEWSYA